MSTNKLYTILTATFLVGFFVFLSATPALAALEYKTLEAIPLIGSQPSGNDFPAYLQGLYNFAFLAIPLCALFMISVGGFMYLTSGGNTSQMGTAKDIIFDSIIGIFIAFLAWLFLYVINPDLVNINIGLGQLSATGTGTGTGTGTPATGTTADTIKRIRDAGVGISISGRSEEEAFTGISESAVAGVIKLKKDCGCAVTITSAVRPESNGSAHQGGNAMDLREDLILGSFLVNKKTSAQLGQFNISKICTTPSWYDRLSTNCGSFTEPASSPHFHLQF